MDKEETLALYNKGREAWNAWANEMLAQQIKLKETGEWRVMDDVDVIDSYVRIGKNHVTQDWLTTARVDFSNQTFETDTCFAGFVFPGQAVFAIAKFAKSASFKQTKFSELANFKGATFSSVTFALARFGRHCGFHGV